MILTFAGNRVQPGTQVASHAYCNMIFDFRLHVFRVAATRLNFTKASEELFISQPAVTKHVHELERILKIKLFERSGPNMKLSQAGHILLRQSDKIFGIYRELEFEINSLMERQSGYLRLGASTTAAQYILPQILAAFRVKFPDIQISLTIENSQEIVESLISQKIDLGITEGRARDASMKFIEFVEDEIVLVAQSKNPHAGQRPLTFDKLKKIPLLVRESGSGTLDVLADSLKEYGISIQDLNIEMTMSSSESMKRYLLHSQAMAFLSRHVVSAELENNKCRIVQLEGLSIRRHFHFVLPHGQPMPLLELFIRFARHQFKLNQELL